MSGLTSVLKQALIQAALAYSGQSSHRNNFAGAGIIFFSGYLIFSGIIVLGVALYLWLEPQIGDARAALLSGFFLIIVSVLMIFSALGIMNRGKARQEVAARLRAEQLADLMSGDLVDEIKRPVCENPKTAMILAVLAGFIAGERLK